MYKKIQEYISNNKNLIIADRRNLHKIPETAWNEHETHKYLAARLKEMGYTIIEGEEVTGHDTGIIAELSLGQGPVMAMRFDIDALPIKEPIDTSHLPAAENFLSEHDGFMHACGHDGHMAIGLAVANALMYFKGFNGTVRLIFQPAEEGCKGANAITGKGWLDDADYFVAGHIVGRDYDADALYDVIPGASASLATTKIDVTFTGRPCHASEPASGLSVMPAIASAITKMSNIEMPAEVISGQEKALLNIGRVNAGEGRNIIAGNGSMELEVRGSTTEINSYMEENALRILRESADEFGVGLDIDILGTAPSLVSSPELSEMTKKLCANVLTGIRCAPQSLAFRASEDAAIMLERVKKHGGKGIFFLFTTDTTALLHQPIYDFNEDILTKAATVMTALAYEIL